jgi:HAMP domain-containing protein
MLERVRQLWRRLRFDPQSLRLGVLLAALNVVLVLLVVLAIFVTATGLLEDLASENALARVQLDGAVARENVRRLGEDVLTSARLLGERPTLQRLLKEDRSAAIEPFLARFCETSGGDACAVIHGSGLIARAGVELPWDLVIAAEAEQGERFLMNAGEVQPAVLGGSASVGGSTDQRVIVVHLLDERLAKQLSQSLGAKVSLVSYDSFSKAATGELTRLHSAALSDGQSAAQRLSDLDAYVSSVPLFAASGEAVAFIQTELPGSEVASAVARFKLRLLGMAFVVALIALGAGLLLGEQVVRPLRALTTAAVRLGRGDLSTSIPRRGAMEVGALARTME